MEDSELIARAMHMTAVRVCGFQPCNADDLIVRPRSTFQKAVSQPLAKPDLIPAWSLFLPDALRLLAELSSGTGKGVASGAYV